MIHFVRRKREIVEFINVLLSVAPRGRQKLSQVGLCRGCLGVRLAAAGRTPKRFAQVYHPPTSICLYSQQHSSLTKLSTCVFIDIPALVAAGSRSGTPAQRSRSAA